MTNVFKLRSKPRLAKQRRRKGVRPQWLSRLGYYGLALLFVAAAAMLHGALPQVLGATPLLAFYLAWVGAAVFGGLGPGLLAALASWLCVVVLFHSTAADGLTEFEQFAVLMVGGLTVSLIAEVVRRGRLRESRQSRKLAEQARALQTTNEGLRRSEEKYRALVENSLIGIGISKGDRILYANQSLLRMFGYDTFEEFAARPILEHLTPASRRVVEQWRQRRRRGEQVPAVLEHDIIRKDGAVRTLQFSCSYLSEEDGACVHTAFVDVTERKRVEAALAESRKKYRGLVEKVNDWVWEIDAHGVYTYVSPRVRELLGYEPEEIVGKTPFDLMPPAEAQRVWNAFEPIWRAHQPLELLANTLVRKDGRQISVETSGLPVFAADGTFQGYTGIDRDVTARQRAEEALRASQHMLRLVMESVPQAIFWKDRQSVFLGCNTAFAQDAGLASAEDIVGKTDYDLPWSPEQTASYREYDRRIMESDTPQYHILEPQRDSAGRLTWLETNKIPLHDAQGHVIGILGTYEDITERKQAEEALHELNATLESRVARRTAELQERTRQLQKLTLEMSEAEDRERQRIAQILHDDLQQILAGACFHLGLMKSRARQDPSIQTIAGQVGQMLKDAIDKSRDLSHELGPAVLYHSDFAETLRWLAGRMRDKHGLIVHLRTQGPMSLPSDAIKTFLSRATGELLFNVAKHAQVREAWIRARARGRWLGVSVRDRGHGFDPQKLREAPGLGLLGIRERIELLGGRLKIRSAEGKGSRFSIVVPLGEPAEIKPEVETKPIGRTAEAKRVASTGSARLRVLLADDHQIVRQGIVSLLKEEQAVEVVGEATTGREALVLADELRPDVVIMDVSMPEMSGEEATRRIKEDLPQTRIISLSMYEEPEVRERMHRAGAEGYVLKTAPTEELLAAIRG